VEGKISQRGQYGFAFANERVLTLLTGPRKQRTSLPRRQTHLDRRSQNARPGPTEKRQPGEFLLRVHERPVSYRRILHSDDENESSSDTEAAVAPASNRQTRSRKIIAR